MAEAEAALDEGRQEHEAIAAEIENDRASVDKRAKAEDSRWTKKLERFTRICGKRAGKTQKTSRPNPEVSPSRGVHPPSDERITALWFVFASEALCPQPLEVRSEGVVLFLSRSEIDFGLPARLLLFRLTFLFGKQAFILCLATDAHQRFVTRQVPNRRNPEALSGNSVLLGGGFTLLTDEVEKMRGSLSCIAKSAVMILQVNIVSLAEVAEIIGFVARVAPAHARTGLVRFGSKATSARWRDISLHPSSAYACERQLCARSGHSTITCFARLLTRVTTRDSCSHEVRLDRDVTVRRRGQCGCEPVRLRQSAKPKPRANPNIRASAFNGRLNLSMTLDQIYNHFGRDDVRDRFFEGQHPVPSCFT